ncbi:MAG: hypothetical protein ACK5V3_10450 [Bdellovibrionales bacterium]
MGKIYWLGVIFVVCLGLFTAWYVADQRQNQVLLKPQSFQSVNSIVEALTPFLEPEKSPRQWTFIGLELQNPGQLDLTKALITKLSEASPRVVVVDNFLGSPYGGLADHQFNFQKNYENWVEEISKLSQGRPIVVIAPNIYFSHIPFDSLTNISLGMMQALDFEVLTVTSFPLTESERKNFFLPCSESQQLKTSLSDFGCYVRHQSQVRKSEFDGIPSPHGHLLRFNDRELVLFLRDAR